MAPLLYGKITLHNHCIEHTQHWIDIGAVDEPLRGRVMFRQT